jgi:hypothetical protein
LSEKQIPQVLVFIRSHQNEENVRAGVCAPRQVRYQAALRPDMTGKTNLKHFAALLLLQLLVLGLDGVGWCDRLSLN